MVHETEIDLACCRGLDDRRVLLVLLRVVLPQVEEPLTCRVVTGGEAHGGHERLERRIRGSDSDSSLPLRLSQLEDGVGNLVLRERLGVVDDDARASGRAYPPALGVAKPLRDHLQDSVRERIELSLDRAQGARILRPENVRRGVLGLLCDRRRELGAVAVAHLDLDPRLVREQLEERGDELLLAP